MTIDRIHVLFRNKIVVQESWSAKKNDCSSEQLQFVKHSFVVWKSLTAIKGDEIVNNNPYSTNTKQAQHLICSSRFTQFERNHFPAHTDLRSLRSSLNFLAKVSTCLNVSGISKYSRIATFTQCVQS